MKGGPLARSAFIICSIIQEVEKNVKKYASKLEEYYSPGIYFLEKYLEVSLKATQKPVFSQKIIAFLPEKYTSEKWEFDFFKSGKTA